MAVAAAAGILRPGGSSGWRLEGPRGGDGRTNRFCLKLKIFGSQNVCPKLARTDSERIPNGLRTDPEQILNRPQTVTDLLGNYFVRKQLGQLIKCSGSSVCYAIVQCR